MDTLIQRMLKTNSPVAKFEMTEYWLDIGREDDYKKAQETFDQNFPNGD